MSGSLHRNANDVAAWIRRVITIPMLGEELFPGWEPSRSCLSPFRDEDHASFGVSDDGQVFWDNVAGTTGDQFEFYAVAKQLNKKQAFKDLLTMAEAVSEE